MTLLAEPVARDARHDESLRDSVLQQAAAPDPQDSWLHRWCSSTSSLEQRLADINTLSRKRLPTYVAAEVWLHLLGKATGMLGAEQTELLLRQFCMLAPEHGKAGMMYDLLMNKQRPAPQPELVFMIASCQRYMPQARRVLGELQARGAQAYITTGDPSLSVARQEGDLVTLPVSDTYEDLTSKVLEGLTYLRRRHGANISIVKIDDDMALTDELDPAALAHAARIYDYAGEAIGDHCCDRFWHYGKTSVPTPIFTRRQQGRFARGAMYLLGPRAVEHLVREWVYYPGEFSGHVYEDRAVGDSLRRANIEVTPMSIERMGGVVDCTERYIAPVL